VAPDFVSSLNYYHLKIVLIIECTDAICRVPYTVLSLRLSILYLRTCVGLGYGKKGKKQGFALFFRQKKERESERFPFFFLMSFPEPTNIGFYIYNSSGHNISHNP